MPPFNARRRDHLADAAIAVLAREGTRGLTHRAVDAEAEQPPGTTSRYFRTREALRAGVVERVRTLHFADLRRAPRGPVEAGQLAEHLAAMVHAAITTNRVRHLAIIELFMEATRHPDMNPDMAATRIAQIQLMRDIHHAAGVPLTTADAELLVAAITGIVHVALTTPAAVGIATPDDVRPMVRRTVDLLHAAVAERHTA